ncbi:MAG TPA: hypothetical protein IGS53_28080 [Leptolyngbyaceae cyanobacterium M33_DOE_097]|nr:hypothetical protein [Leptolyngbyaceae cyanobacterium M33_DOE_097]
MSIQQVGYMGYQLYRLGWHNATYKHLSPVQHMLLSSFLYYRRGFASGLEFTKEASREKNYW